MSSQLSAHAITAHTAMTRMSISRCSTLPEHRGSSSAEKCSTSFSTDIATLPSLSNGEPKRQSDRQNPASPFHASPLMQQVFGQLLADRALVAEQLADQVSAGTGVVSWTGVSFRATISWQLLKTWCSLKPKNQPILPRWARPANAG